MNTNRGIASVSVALIIVIVGIGAYLMMRPKTPVQAPVQDQGTATSTASSSASAPAGKKAALTISWKFTDQGEDQYGMPRTAVELVANGKTYPAGTFDGRCRVIKAGEQGMFQDDPEPGEQSPRVQCYWAGGGNEIGVFDDLKSWVIKVGVLEEGDAETPGSRGNFKTILSL